MLLLTAVWSFDFFCAPEVAVDFGLANENGPDAWKGEARDGLDAFVANIFFCSAVSYGALGGLSGCIVFLLGSFSFLAVPSGSTKITLLSFEACIYFTLFTCSMVFCFEKSEVGKSENIVWLKGGNLR